MLALLKGNPRWNRILQLLAGWKITLEINVPADDTERGVLMVLSQTYLEWEKATEKRGIQKGIQQGIQAERRTRLRLCLRLGLVC